MIPVIWIMMELLDSVYLKNAIISLDIKGSIAYADVDIIQSYMNWPDLLNKLMLDFDRFVLVIKQKLFISSN